MICIYCLMNMFVIDIIRIINLAYIIFQLSNDLWLKNNCDSDIIEMGFYVIDLVQTRKLTCTKFCISSFLVIKHFVGIWNATGWQVYKKFSLHWTTHKKNQNNFDTWALCQKPILICNTTLIYGLFCSISRDGLFKHEERW